MSRREWDLTAGPYDALQRVLEPGVLRGTRRWIASRASGRTLDVAIGSGLTLPHYPHHVGLAGLDISPRMLGMAARGADAREHWRRHPLPIVVDLGFAVEAHDRFLAGVVERLAAR